MCSCGHRMLDDCIARLDTGDEFLSVLPFALATRGWSDHIRRILRRLRPSAGALSSLLCGTTDVAAMLPGAGA